MESINTRTIEFPIGMKFPEEGKLWQHISVTIKISVTPVNENGVFKIITQIGDEEPTERITTINNENIVKTT